MAMNPDVSRLILHMAERGKVVAEAFCDREEVVRGQLLPWEVTDPLLRAVGMADSHLSDLLIDLRAIVRDIKDQDDAYYVVAIRKLGVDHNCYFNIRMKEFYDRCNHTAMDEYYRRVFILEYHLVHDMPEDSPLWAYNGKLHFILKDVIGTHPYDDPDR